MNNYDLLIYNVHRVDVGLLAITDGWFTVKDGRIAQLGETGSEPFECCSAAIDGEGAYAVPSFIDAHMHIESSFTTPRRFVEAALPSGTAGVLADPHEIANVAGVVGVEYLIKAAEDLPMDIYFALPSCVPATDTSLETPGATFGVDELAELYSKSNRFIALGEVMDYISLIDPNSRLFPILKWAKSRGLIIDGHCPALSPENRQRYFAQGVMADHTLTFPEKIRSELQMGVWVKLQEKSVTQENIDYLQEVPLDQILFITDDYAPSKFKDGHLNTVVRKAIQLGLDPIQAVASASLRPARYLGLRDAGIIAPGKWANFWLTEDLDSLQPTQVYYRGEYVEKLIEEAEERVVEIPEVLHKSCHLPKLTPEDIKIKVEGPIPVIVSNNVTTETKLEWLDFSEDPLTTPLPEGYTWAMCVQRHTEERQLALCLLKNFGPHKGAFASTVAHDSHNLIAIGSLSDIFTAVDRLQSIQGGMVAVEDGQILSEVALPIAGLLSDQPVSQLASDISKFETTMKQLGISHQRALTFFIVLPLTVSPYYKLSDQGVVDVQERKIIWHHQKERCEL